MVFSFFKKDPKDPGQRAGKSGTRGARGGQAGADAGRAGAKPGSVARGRTPEWTDARPAPAEGIPAERDAARTLALETAAKIDAIESEMARDFLRPLGGSGSAATDSVQAPLPAANTSSLGDVTASPVETVSSVLAAADEEQIDENFDPGTDVLAGSIDAIEINTSGAGSVIDETAILFSNGQTDAAEAVLRTGLRADDMGPATQHAWLMLFELINQRGDKAAFERLATDYGSRFGDSAPAWVDYVDAPARAEARPAAAKTAPAANSTGEPVVRLSPNVDAGVVKQLEELKKHATAHAALKLDMSDVSSIDLVGAELLLRVLNAFKRARHELTLAGAESFLTALRASTEPGRRDSTDAAWMLLLEMLRVLDRQEDFDETAIQYCITFEVSPPSWEPPPPNLKPAPATAAERAPAATSVASGFEWQGVIEREGEPHYGRLLAAARTNPQIVVDCTQLRRMAFSAASAMLTLARRVRQSGGTVELHGVNPLIGALLHLLGVTSVATIQGRRG